MTTTTRTRVAATALPTAGQVYRSDGLGLDRHELKQLRRALLEG